METFGHALRSGEQDLGHHRVCRDRCRSSPSRPPRRAKKAWLSPRCRPEGPAYPIPRDTSPRFCTTRILVRSAPGSEWTNEVHRGTSLGKSTVTRCEETGGRENPPFSPSPGRSLPGEGAGGWETQNASWNSALKLARRARRSRGSTGRTTRRSGSGRPARSSSPASPACRRWRRTAWGLVAGVEIARLTRSSGSSAEMVDDSAAGAVAQPRRAPQELRLAHGIEVARRPLEHRRAGRRGRSPAPRPPPTPSPVAGSAPGRLQSRCARSRCGSRDAHARAIHGPRATRPTPARCSRSGASVRAGPLKKPAAYESPSGAPAARRAAASPRRGPSSPARCSRL